MSTFDATFYPVSTFAVKADKFLDYVPFVSAINNTVDLLAKAVFAILSTCFAETYENIEDYPIVKHLNKKTVSECILLAVPFLNVYMAVSRDCPNKNRSGWDDDDSDDSDDFSFDSPEYRFDRLNNDEERFLRQGEASFISAGRLRDIPSAYSIARGGDSIRIDQTFNQTLNALDKMEASLGEKVRVLQESERGKKSQIEKIAEKSREQTRQIRNGLVEEMQKKIDACPDTPEGKAQRARYEILKQKFNGASE